MKFRITRHAEEEITRRGIPREFVDAVLKAPEEIIPGTGGKEVYQSQKVFESGKVFLLRVVVDGRAEPPTVVTAYRTSKVDKYRRSQP